MFKLVGSYFGQVLLQSLILGLVFYLALLVPGQFKVIFGVAGLYLLWRIPKDPRTHWKRMFTMVMALAAIGGSIEGLIAAGVNVPEQLRADLFVKFLPGIDSWLVFGLAALVVFADVAQEFFSLRRHNSDGELWGQADTMASKVTGPIGKRGFSARGQFQVGLRGGKSPLKLTTVDARLKGLFWIKCAVTKVVVTKARINYQGTENAPALEADKSLGVYCDIEVGERWKEILLFWWRGPRQWVPRSGAITLGFSGTGGPRLTVPVKFKPNE